MTASSSKPRFSTAFKFPKALVAAVLVGRGGGSSNTASEPTPAEKAISKIQAAYDAVNSLVQDLTVDSSDGAIQDARMQVDGLLSDVRTSANLSDSDQSNFLDLTQNLETRIEDIEDRQKMAMENLT